MTRQWSINGRFLTQPLTGVQRYAWEVVHALDALVANGDPRAADLHLEILVPPGAARSLPVAAIRTRSVAGPTGQLWEQRALLKAASGGLLSLCNTGPVAHSRQIVCIHDASTRSVPESYAYAFRTLYRFLQPRAVPARGRSYDGFSFLGWRTRALSHCRPLQDQSGSQWTRTCPAMGAPAHARDAPSRWPRYDRDRR